MDSFNIRLMKANALALGLLGFMTAFLSEVVLTHGSARGLTASRDFNSFRDRFFHGDIIPIYKWYPNATNRNE